ncbi:MAG: hypothetical protein HYT34_02045 [Candidatus Ryanbacteria bacterium]|nr:hypothetical protein [Candidatus Ryanbacteria bacterium]
MATMEYIVMPTDFGLRKIADKFAETAGNLRNGSIAALKIAARIRSLHYAFREARSAREMFINSYDFDPRLFESARAESPYRKSVIILQGFLARVDYYNQLLVYFHNHGIPVIFPQNLVRNNISWSESDKIVSDTIKRTADETGLAPDLICHSRGCLDGLRVLSKHPGIDNIFTVAPPFWGLSYNFLAMYMQFWYKDPGTPIDPDILKDPDILQKVINIFSTRDRIVTPEEAKLVGVRREIVIDEADFRNHPNDARWNTHTGLPLYVRRRILRELYQTTTKAA